MVMKSLNARRYGVITGDIVASSQLKAPERRRLLKVIGESSRLLRGIMGKAVPMEVDVFRGDSWQMLVTDPPRALRAALVFRALLRWKMGAHRLDTRLAIGVGPVDLLPRRRVSEGSGEAFRRSGHALDAMKKRGMTFSSGGGDDEGALDAIVHLLDEIASGWTEKQAWAVVGAMRGRTQQEISATWGNPRITQQTAAQHLDAAGWHAVKHGLDEFEARLTRALGGEAGHH
jgi:hypothetical protein